MHGQTPPSSDPGGPDVHPIADALRDALDKRALIRRWLDDWQASAAFWRYVAARGGLREDTWVFVADPAHVDEILRDELRFSVSEYDRRMRATSGHFLLGMDSADHARNAAVFEIIPSVNRWGSRTPHVADLAALDAITLEAEHSTRAVLTRLAELTRISRISRPDLPCRCTFETLMAPVLDRAAKSCFGIEGPSAGSFAIWGGATARYHFRLAAEESEGLLARQASAQFRAHVLAAISEGKSDRLNAVVSQLRAALGGSVSDDDVARNLIGVVTGSLAATMKAFSEGLTAYVTGLGNRDRRCEWSQIAGAAAEFPLYDALIAAPLARARRGSLDAIYRVYCADEPAHFGTLTVSKRDTVVVWLGGTLAPKHEDNLFGIGMHKCPGMDMGKAIMSGVLRALTQLTGAAAPRLLRDDGESYLVFDDIEAVNSL